MTIEELALEYSRSAAMVRERIRELEQAMKEADDGLRLQLEGRIRPLRAIYRDTRKIARYLEHYYKGRRGREG